MRSVTVARAGTELQPLYDGRGRRPSAVRPGTSCSPATSDPGRRRADRPRARRRGAGHHDRACSTSSWPRCRRVSGGARCHAGPARPDPPRRRRRAPRSGRRGTRSCGSSAGSGTPSRDPVDRGPRRAARHAGPGRRRDLRPGAGRPGEDDPDRPRRPGRRGGEGLPAGRRPGQGCAHGLLWAPSTSCRRGPAAARSAMPSVSSVASSTGCTTTPAASSTTFRHSSTRSASSASPRCPTRSSARSTSSESRLAAMNPDALSDEAKLAVRGALAVLEALDVEGKVVTVLDAGYAELDSKVRDLLDDIAAGLERLHRSVGELDPQTLLGAGHQGAHQHPLRGRLARRSEPSRRPCTRSCGISTAGWRPCAPAASSTRSRAPTTTASR